MFLADFGAYDLQFEGFGGDYVFWAGSAQSEGRRHMHPRIKSPPVCHVCVSTATAPQSAQNECVRAPGCEPRAGLRATAPLSRLGRYLLMNEYEFDQLY